MTWIDQEVWVSEIVYSGTEATRLMPVFTGTKDEVEAKWRSIIRAAQNYAFAEQLGFTDGPKFERWPISLYKSFQTNSNTFIRHLVNSADLVMTEMSINGSLHPGNFTPSQNRESIGGLERNLYEEFEPWHKNGPANLRPGFDPPQ